jgi:uncharacterized protein DUF4350
VNRRRWVGLGAVIAVFAVVVLLRGTGGADSPEHSSRSDVGNGASALRYYAEALGHTTGTVEGDFTLPSSPSLLFVFNPSTAFSGDQAQQLNSWTSSGNVLVYAAEGDADLQLDKVFGLRRSSAAVEGTGKAAAPVFAGVEDVAGALRVRALIPAPSHVPLLRNRNGDVLGVRVAIGSGQLIALTDPLALCNGYLRVSDNGRFAADLLAMTPYGGKVLFDEFHHGEMAGASPEVAWMTTPWGAALLGAVIVVFLGLAMRGRAFGPLIPLRARSDRSSAEYATAVGSLLHRTGARRVTLETLLSATRRAVAERVGLGSDVPRTQLTEAIEQRAPQAGAALTKAEASLPAALVSEEEVLQLARRLHELAYPLSAFENTKGGST